MERVYEYILCKKASESYGDIVTRVLKTYSKQKAIDRMITDAGWLMENEEYQKIKEAEPEDQFTIVKTGSRVHFYIEQIEVDFEGAPFILIPKEYIDNGTGVAVVDVDPQTLSVNTSTATVFTGEMPTSSDPITTGTFPVKGE